MRVFKKKAGEYLRKLEVGKDFFDRIQKALIIKYHKSDIIQVQVFCLSNNTIKKTRRQDTDWQKTYLIKICYPKYFKKSLKLNNKKTNNLIQKWAKDLNR